LQIKKRFRNLKSPVVELIKIVHLSPLRGKGKKLRNKYREAVAVVVLLFGRVKEWACMGGRLPSEK
jgi:hypothetical protein